MPTPPDNPGNARPLSEEQILDWVEGRVDGEAVSRLAAASGRAGLSERVVQMQANRRALQSLGVERAPKGLADRVVAALERDALLGLAEGTPAPPPIQITDHVRSGPARWARMGPGLALAAGLALVITGTVYWSNVLFGGGPAQAPRESVGPMAIATGPADASPAARAKTSAESAPPADSAPAATMMAASGPAQEPAAHEPLTPERAAELARAGRLVIRVAATSTRALSQLETMGNGRNHRAWRLQKDVPPAVSAAILATVAAPAIPADFVGPVMAAAHPANVASLIAPMVGPRAAFNLTPPRIERDGSVIAGSYLLEVPADAEAISGVASILGERLKGEVRMEALPDAVPTPPSAPDPGSLLWWTQTPQNWTPRASVPIVIEERL
jgi:hypothetical protein